MRAAILALLLAGCSRTPAPTPPKQPEIDTTIVCFVLESHLGAGFVCAERKGPCDAVRREVAKSEAVTAISECRKAHVTATIKE